MSIENLKAEAESLGIEVDGRWSEKRLQNEIDLALGDGASGETEADEPETEADQEATEQQAAEPEAQEPAPVAKKPGDVTVSNPTKCIQVIGTTRVKPGAKYTLDAEQKKDGLLMKRLRNAIKLGLLTEV